MTISIMGQPKPIRRLVGYLWNLYVKRSLEMVRVRLFFPEMVFLGKFARVRVSRVIRRKQGLKMNNEGSATPITASQNWSGMSLKQQLDIRQTNLFEQKHGSGFDSRRLPHFIMRKNK